MRFRDQRKTVTKRLPDELKRDPKDLLPVDPATPRYTAPAKNDPEIAHPNHNRASRRQSGRFKSHKWAASRRGAAKLMRSPLPWKDAEDGLLIPAAGG